MGRDAGMEVEEGFYSAAEFEMADEVFLTNTVSGVAPVTEIDGFVVGSGKPGRAPRRGAGNVGYPSPVQLDRRYLLWSAAATAFALLLMGIPAAIIPNPVFGRSVAVEPWAVATWAVSSALVGLIAGTYLAPPSSARHLRPHGEPGGARITAGAALAYFAVACPVCNKIVVAALGVSGALNVFAPLQPIMAVASVALLGATLAWRLRMRARGCTVCAEGAVGGGEPRRLGS